MMLMMMPYYEFHDCIDTLDSGRSERDDVGCEERVGVVKSDHVTDYGSFPTITSSSAKLLAQSFNPLFSLLSIIYQYVVISIHPFSGMVRGCLPSHTAGLVDTPISRPCEYPLPPFRS
jgi:hypothetical protein